MSSDWSRLLFYAFLSLFLSNIYTDDAVLICVLTSADKAYKLWLFCYKSLNCELRSTPILLIDNIIKGVSDWDALTSDCTMLSNSSLAFAPNHSQTALSDKYTVLQSEIAGLTFKDVTFSRLPVGFFCKLTKLTRLDLKSNKVRDTLDFGFAGPHDWPDCCMCNLQHLYVKRNGVQVVGDASFREFYNLRTLDLSLNEISAIGTNAFVHLTSLQELVLSHNRLKEIPTFAFRPLTKLGTLDLRVNQLDGDVFLALQHTPMLEKLNLQMNKVAEIPSGAVDFLSLRVLDLSSNRLGDWQTPSHLPRNLRRLIVADNNIGNVSRAFFEPMESLEEINLYSTNLRSLPEGLFAKNRHLKKLDLFMNELTAIPKLCTDSLESLNLASNDLRNLTVWDRENLCRMVNLTSVELKDNEVRDVVPEMFACGMATALERVDLARNRIESMSRVFDKSRIRILDLSRNRLSAFSFEDVPDDLRELDLNGNQIREVHSDAAVLDRPMALKKLILSRNNLTSLTDVTLPSRLEHLDLSYNQIYFFSFAKEAAGTISSHLQVINFYENAFEIACPWMTSPHGQHSNVTISMGHNPLRCPCEVSFFSKGQEYDLWTTNELGAHPGCPAAMLNSSAVVAGRLSANGRMQLACDDSILKLGCQCNEHPSYAAVCHLPCPESCACFVDAAFATYLTNCSGQEWVVVQQMPAMRPNLSLIADFSSNQLRSLEPSAFDAYAAAVELYLDDNLLATIAGNAFRTLVRLQVLTLERNILEELPSDLFAGLVNLTGLYLAGNRLAYLAGDIFAPLVSLQTLHLQNNRLTNFTVWNLYEATSLSDLRLYGNPWSCDCNYVERFQPWLLDFYSQVSDAKDLYCVIDGDAVHTYPLLLFNASYCYTSALTMLGQSVTPIWASVVAVVVLLTVATVLLFVYRHEMQVLFYSRYGLRFFPQDLETEEGKAYDAFVAYSSYDDEFVIHTLIPGLEQIERPYRLCVHERDFLVGAIITESILEAVDKSRRTIVVLSENFVKSGFCRFEFKSAHLQMLSDRCSRVIVIVLDDVPKDTDPEIQLYLKTNTYLKWGDKLFWQKLYFAMPDRTVHAKSPVNVSTEM